MTTSHHFATLLLVTSSNETAAQFAKMLPAERFLPEFSVCIPREAEYVMSEDTYDVVVIDSTVPLADGRTIASKASAHTECNVLLLTAADCPEEIAGYAEKNGFMTLSMPVNPSLLKQSLSMMASMADRMHTLQDEADRLRQEMDDMRLINRAKLILVQRFKMSEKDAHRFIEKNAMDRCVKKSIIAQGIIRTYQN